eukprot:TRINITY_DN16853_c0_g1_i4.p1 TRINITY_DN16853_c0_g1~~TRINITY_DN16853_c0_g1_i4.p1  ORF type:complete len:345 (-),score=62.81 TRINITY_DN16853_c0_g1_i4:583-1617(-)
MTMTLSQTDVLMYIIIVTNSLSFVGSLLAIIIYWRYSDLRAFSHKLTHRVAWCALGYASAKLIVPVQNFLNYDGYNSWLCITQTTLAIFFQLASSFYCVCVAFVVYKVLVDVSFAPEKLERKFDLMAIPAAVCAVIPVITKNYKRVGYWCWYDQDSALVNGFDWIGRIEEALLFFAPLLISIGYILLVTIKVQRRLNSMRRDALLTNLGEDTARHLRALKRLRLYPVVMVVVFSFPIADQIYFDVRKENWFVLSLLHCFANGCLGLGHSIIFFANERIRDRLKHFLCGIEPEDDDWRTTTTRPTNAPENRRLLIGSAAESQRQSLAKLAETAAAVVSPKKGEIN